MKRYKATLEVTIDAPDYDGNHKEHLPNDIIVALLDTKSPKTNGYAIATLGKLTATLHVDKVTFHTAPCPCGHADMFVVEKLP